MEVIVFFCLVVCPQLIVYAFGADSRGKRTLGLPVKRWVLLLLVALELVWYAVQLNSYDPPDVHGKSMHLYFVDVCLFTFPRGAIPTIFEDNFLHLQRDGTTVKIMVITNALVADYLMLLLFSGIHRLVMCFNPAHP